MSGGFLALLDGVASTLSGVAAASVTNITSATKASLRHLDDVAGMIRIGSSKSSAIVVDDIPVNAQALADTRIPPERELTVVGKIMKGSFLNKLAIIPLALGVSAISPAVPWLMPAILAAGGAYLAYEGTEKTLGMFLPHLKHKHAEGTLSKTAAETEKKLIGSALKTDVVMSAEIMFIALGAMSAAGGLLPTAIALTAVGAATTAGIYGLVGGLVKLDDMGLRLQEAEGNSLTAKASRAIGPLMVKGLPHIMKGLSYLGTGAMLYVGGALMGHAIPAAEHFFHAASTLGTHLPPFLSAVSAPVGWFAKTCAEQAVGIAGGLSLIAGNKVLGPAFAPVIDFVKNAFSKLRGAESKIDIAVDDPAPTPAPALALSIPISPAPEIFVRPVGIETMVKPAEAFPRAVMPPAESNDNDQTAIVQAPSALEKREPGMP